MNGQTEREYRDALDGVRFSGEARRRMVKNLETGQAVGAVTGKGFRPLRAGLIAACLCLALVGTAFAATAVYRLTVRTGEWEGWGSEYTGYRVHGGPVIHPMEDFSQELQDDFAAWNHPSLLFSRKFGAWEEARAYLGDSIPAVWHSTGGIDANEFPAEYRVQGHHEMYGDNRLQYVKVVDNGVRLSDMLSFHTEMYVYTPDYCGEFLTGGGWWKDSGDFQVLDSYTMANGCVAEAVVGTMGHEDFEGETHRYIGAFMRDGILYKVELSVPIQCTLDGAELEARLHQILDSFG